MLDSSRQDKKGKPERVIVGFGGKIFSFISSGRKIDIIKRNVSPRRAWSDSPLAVVPMVWQVGVICN